MRPTRLLTCGVCLSFLLASADAVAVSAPTAAEGHDPPTSVEPRLPSTAVPPPPLVWYGWQIMAVDVSAVAVTIGLGAVSKDAGVTLVSGLVPYVLGGPVVHGIRGHWARAGLSMGERVGLPFIGGAIGFAAVANDKSCNLACIAIPMFGMVAGGVAAMILDWTALGFDRPEIRPQSSRLVVLPTVAVLPDRLNVGLVGTF